MCENSPSKSIVPLPPFPWVSSEGTPQRFPTGSAKHETQHANTTHCGNHSHHLQQVHTKHTVQATLPKTHHSKPRQVRTTRTSRTMNTTDRIRTGPRLADAKSQPKTGML
uniref:Uncharacterized protein n=1 Tax=Eutreptiella gymnastica TaxID=73025 RepID=A0A7S4CH77_9EUGL